MTDWLEVSMTVKGELAEAVADVFSRFAPNGVMTEQAVDFVNEEDEGTPVGPIIVRAYLPADEHLGETRLKLEESLYYLGMIEPLPEPVYKQIEDQNWMEKWKLRYQPISVGKYLEIMPSWTEPQIDPLRIPLKINPGMAFGTGSHPSTHMVLELIEESIRGYRDLREQGQLTVIDVGCGSGILSIGALKLGASRALGVDIDDNAIANSRENAQLNEVEDRFEVGLGTVKDIRERKFSFSSASLVFANILAPVIIRLFEDGLGELVSPEGALFLSGILVDQGERVIAAAADHGFVLSDKRQMDDWVAFVVKRKI
jgi:ribosomal protein L11 methyltransferase